MKTQSTLQTTHPIYTLRGAMSMPITSERSDPWPACITDVVAMLVGPRVTPDDALQQRLNALNLAAAALDFAGETSLAAEVRERLEDIGGAAKPQEEFS
ncbi:hypothetical protein [Variovorax sp. 350MFTsu5.1]|uniref:hypothetical protein n=1 Tax=Variovorax sp. 350MFTsu5.1 TaxID=3158365 RepID=UPI003AAA6F09